MEQKINLAVHTFIYMSPYHRLASVVKIEKLVQNEAIKWLLTIKTERYLQR